MEQVAQGSNNMEMTGASMSAGKKEGRGMAFGMFACAILAVAGIGFGVYELMEANAAKQQISDLKIEVKNDDGTTTTVETEKIEVKEDTKTIVITDSPKVEHPERYIYVAQWGIKIQLPEELSLVTYSFDYTETGPVANAGENASLCVSGSMDNSLYEFSSVRKRTPGLICVSRYSHEQEHLVNMMPIFSDETGYYYISGAQAYVSEEGMARNYEENTMNLLEKHFSSPSNYSAI